MDSILKRFTALSPKQRELLALKLKKQGLDPLLVEEEPAPAMAGKTAARVRRHRSANKPIDFSLLFFSDDGSTERRDKYGLLIESAKFADEHDFCAIWTPERHFQDFGGLYPNPSVVSAALAMITKRIQIRAGSVTLPLHHPIRVAEEWSVIDNLSNGRIGVSFASGWHPHDFTLSPENYENRKPIMLDNIKLIQRLWAGEKVLFPGAGGNEVEIKLLPKPLQKTLPVWITSSGSAETWVKAGEIGANILSGVRSDPFDDFAQKVELYRSSLAKHGHDPQKGRVTAMLHTFIGEDDETVREKVRVPLIRYLSAFIAQGESFSKEELGFDSRSITQTDRQTLASMAFERYFNTSSLLGSADKCARMIDHLKEVGVDEVACLIDFGPDVDSVMEGLHRLNELRQRCNQGTTTLVTHHL